jgi:hypothetical protein
MTELASMSTPQEQLPVTARGKHGVILSLEHDQGVPVQVEVLFRLADGTERSEWFDAADVRTGWV